MASVIYAHPVKDSGGNVIAEVQISEEVTPTTAPQWFSHRCTIDETFVVIGGGAATIPGGVPGALLTASHPDPSDRRSWVAASKEHLDPFPHQLACYAIGLKIMGVSTSDLAAKYTRLTPATSAPGNHLEASATVPVSDGFKLIGGGFEVDLQPGDAGNFATASFPEFGETWTARSKDHGLPDRQTLTSWAVSIRTAIAIPQAGATALIRHITVVPASEVSNRSDTPSALVMLPGGLAIAGLGAETRYEGPGQLLTNIRPTVGAGVRWESQRVRRITDSQTREP